MSEILGGISSLTELFDLEEKHSVTLGGPGLHVSADRLSRRVKKAPARKAAHRAKKAVARKSSYRAKRAAKRAR